MAVFDDGLMPSPDVNVDPSRIDINEYTDQDPSVECAQR